MSFLEIKGKKIGEGLPKICVPLVGHTLEEMLYQAEIINEPENSRSIDIVEVRADYFDGLGSMDEVNRLMTSLQSELSDKIVLFTIRSEKEGGNTLPSDITDIDGINSFVISNKLADIVDVELGDGDCSRKKLVCLAHKNEVGIIMSYHNFSATPDLAYIANKLEAMHELGADICKVAVMPENKQDVYRLMEAAIYAKEKHNVPLVAISMGTLGAITRITGSLFGSDITFAALEQASAPGQIPVADLKKLMDGIERYCK